MEKVKTSISLDKDVFDYLQKLSERERISVSQIINREYALKMEQEGKN